MSKRTWIKIHNGLTSDPQHRARLGVRVWLFMWLIDQVEWETGIVWDYTDKRAAMSLSDDENKISPRTIEDQRQQLERDGYVICHAAFQCQHIRIMRWRNPREVTPDQINVPGQRETWYDLSRRHTTTFPVPIPTESSVPLHIDHTESHVPLARLYEDCYGFTVSPHQHDKLKDLEAEYTYDWLSDALKESAERNKKDLRYVEAMLRRWKIEGRNPREVTPGNGNGHKPAPAQDRKPKKVYR